MEHQVTAETMKYRMPEIIDYFRTQDPLGRYTLGDAADDTCISGYYDFVQGTADGKPKKYDETMETMGCPAGCLRYSEYRLRGAPRAEWLGMKLENYGANGASKEIESFDKAWEQAGDTTWNTWTWTYSVEAEWEWTCAKDACGDSMATNYDPAGVWQDEPHCTYVYGCTNPDATNHNAKAGRDDGSCILPEPLPAPAVTDEP